MVTPGALLRYRVMAYVTGVMLLLLVFVAIPIQVWGHNTGPVAVIGTAHGWLFMAYVVTAFWLGFRLRWNPVVTVLVMVAGTVPFASFYAERKVVAMVRPRLVAQGATVDSG